MTDAPTTPATPKGPPLSERLGWRTHRRPEPGFAHVLGAAAGAFAVVAVVALVVEITSGDATASGVLLDLALAVGAFVAGIKLAGPVRNAAVTAVVLTVPLIWGFAFLGGGTGGSGAVRGIYLLSIASYGALYLLGWTRGRAIFLAALLLFFAGWIISEVGSGNSVAPFQQQIESQANVDTGTGLGTTTSNGLTVNQSDDSTSTAIVALLLGVGYLAAGAALDRRKLAGAATPFIAIGALYTIVGAVVLGSDQSTLLGGLLTAASGAAIGLVGGLGTNRRGSTWIGVIVVFIGLAVVIGDLAGSALGVAGLAALFAAALLAVGITFAPRLKEAIDGDDVAAARG